MGAIRGGGAKVSVCVWLEGGVDKDINNNQLCICIISFSPYTTSIYLDIRL